MMPVTMKFLLFASSAFAMHLASGTFSDLCEVSLSAQVLGLPNTTTVHSSTFISANSNLSVPASHPTCPKFISQVPSSFCRLQLRTKTGFSSGVEFEAWLPQNWTGRFLTIGNTGIAGCIQYSDMIYGMSRGFAVVGSDNGHAGNTGEPFLNNSDVLEDYAYRSIHIITNIGKQIFNAFYGQGHTRAYYLGCSTGGRQGFMEAQRFPEDFDGIVVGAPAFDFNHLVAHVGHIATITGPSDSPDFITPDLWQVIIKDVLRQCDSLDGYVDGIIEDTDLCQYIPEALLCGDGRNLSCITPRQTEIVRGIFSPLYGKDGNLVFPRFPPGMDPTTFFGTGQMFMIAQDWMRYVITGDPNWDGKINLAEIEAISRVDPFGISTYRGDLSGARDRGTKILHYHGLQDELISSDNSARYYNLVSRTMNVLPKDLDNFYRFFRISGFGHCFTGTGARNIGNNLAMLSGDSPEENVLWAMVKWVEEGKGPEYILGTAFTDAEKKKVKFQRRHCKYPARNRFLGEHYDPNLATSWECV